MLEVPQVAIMEMVGHEPSTVLGTLHYGPPWVFTNGRYNLPAGKFADDFHVFAIEWGPDSIIWEVDDSVYSMKNADSVAHWNVFQERFYLILNLISFIYQHMEIKMKFYFKIEIEN